MDSVQTRLENAKLASAIDNACQSLPEDWIVRVELSKGSATVGLEIDGEEIEFASNHETLWQEIRDAVAHANGAG